MANITASNISLTYPVYGGDYRSIKKSIINLATGGTISTNYNVLEINAIDRASFEINDGDRVGLIGHNGAGKSTLLKLLAQIYKPTTGELYISGRAVSTLNLSLGMEPEATGFENIITRGLLLGMSRKHINDKIHDIAEFTQLGNYLNLPVRVYSSGMLTRLAFATVTSMDADIVIMDEVINTGDATFIEKAHHRLNNFMSRSKILVVASHNKDTIRQFCNKAILLDHGKILAIGNVEYILSKYNTVADGV